MWRDRNCFVNRDCYREIDTVKNNLKVKLFDVYGLKSCSKRMHLNRYTSNHNLRTSELLLRGLLCISYAMVSHLHFPCTWGTMRGKGNSILLCWIKEYIYIFTSSRIFCFTFYQSNVSTVPKEK